MEVLKFEEKVSIETKYLGHSANTWISDIAVLNPKKYKKIKALTIHDQLLLLQFSQLLF